MQNTRQPYDGAFYDFVQRTSTPSAEVIVPMVMNMLSPRSVVDVGCGEGAWLSVFAQKGVDRILGIDGEYVARDRLLIPTDRFQSRDLTQPFAVNEEFDMAVSLEVGEHLPENKVGTLVSSLGSLAPVILFSAAIPGQGGTRHVNEQWPSYWADQFVAIGFDCFDVLRQRLWKDDRITWWYRQNLLLFARRDSVAWSVLSKISDPGRPADLIHPELWNSTQRSLAHVKAAADDPGLKLSLLHVLRALRRRLFK
jgi:hypothetical protein